MLELGREWGDVMNQNCRDASRVNKIKSDAPVNELRRKVMIKMQKDFPKVFNNDMSEPIKDIKVAIRMNP